MAQTVWEKFDLMECPKDLQKYVGKMVYLLFYSENMVGSTKLTDINAFMASEGILEIYSEDPSDMELLYGLVLNVEDLPMEMPDDMPKDYKLYTLKHDAYSTIEREEADDFEAAAEYVEWGIDDCDFSLDIDDFSVIFAKKMILTIQTMSPGSDLTYNHKKVLGVI